MGEKNEDTGEGPGSVLVKGRNLSMDGKELLEQLGTEGEGPINVGVCCEDDDPAVRVSVVELEHGFASKRLAVVVLQDEGGQRGRSPWSRILGTASTLGPLLDGTLASHPDTCC